MGSLIREPRADKGLKIFEDSRFCLALDIGQSVDPTAICVMQHIRKAEVSWKGKERSLGEEFHCRYLRRLPLKLSYIEQAEEVRRLLARAPLDRGCEFAIDETGVGRAVGDIFDDLGLRPTRITITAGHNSAPQGRNRWHVPKQVLISALDARLHCGELKFAAELHEAGAMAEELKDFRRSVSAAGRYSYDARVGRHDDLVLACAIGIWTLTGKPKIPTAQFGRYSYVKETT